MRPTTLRRALRLTQSLTSNKSPRINSTSSTRTYHASVLPNLVSKTSPEFQEKSAAMDELVKDLEGKLAKARLGGGPKAAERMRSKGKKLPRERFVFHPSPPSTSSNNFIIFVNLLCNRLAALLDPDSPFLELSALAAHEVYPGESIPGAGMITGIGRISGRECVVVVNDATVKGGSYYPLTVKKHLRAQEIARENGLPCVYVGEFLEVLLWKCFVKGLMIDLGKPTLYS